MTNSFGAGKVHRSGRRWGVMASGTTKMPPDSQGSLPKNAFHPYVNENTVEL